MARHGRAFPSHPVYLRAPVVVTAPPGGGPVALDGLISCQLRFSPNDTSPLTVAHTLESNVVTQVNITGGTVDQITAQSSVACLAVLSAQLAVAHSLGGAFVTNLTVNDSYFTVSHTLQGVVACYCRLDQAGCLCNLTVVG